MPTPTPTPAKTLGAHRSNKKAKETILAFLIIMMISEHWPGQ